jgi:Tol biopolymer transport system component
MRHSAIRPALSVLAGCAALLVPVMAMLMVGCASSPEAGPTEPISRVDAGTTAPSPQPSSTLEGPFGQVGGWIAYSSGDGIWAVDPARPERRIRLSRADGDLIAWSSDGTKLLIRRKSPNQVRGGIREMDLVVFDADGTETRLTNAQTFVTGGSFSPDGSEVVYATTFSPKGSAIYAVSSDGGAPRLILRATRRVSIEGRSFLTDVYHPALSPDGTQIGYFDGMGDHSHNLWVMNADGTERRLLLDDEWLAGPGHMNALTWSPDGEWLAFQTDNRIYLVRPDGTGLRPVIEKGFFIAASAVQWSPDGSRIAYLRGGALSIVNVDGGNERIVEGIPARSIAWNPAV